MDGPFEVGQTVLYVPSDQRRGSPKELVITKVGRKWVTLAAYGREMRFDPETRRVDGRGYTSPGRVYQSAQEYAAERENRQLHQRLRDLVKGFDDPFTTPQLLAAIGALTTQEASHAE